MRGSNYILKEREFIKTGENILKIGRTGKPGLIRASQYPKGSELIIQRVVDDYVGAEREIMRVFDVKFKNLKKTIGREYYEGDEKEMVKLFMEITEKFISNDKNNKKIIEIKKIDNQLPNEETDEEPVKKSQTIVNKLMDVIKSPFSVVKNLISGNKNPPAKEKFCCIKCEYITTNIGNFKRHTASQEHKDICGPLPENVNYHDYKKKIYPCDICGKEFINSRHRTTHKKKCGIDELTEELVENIVEFVPVQPTIHLVARPVTKPTIQTVKIPKTKKFCCIECEYITESVANFKRHMTSKKHEDLCGPTPETIDYYKFKRIMYSCDICGKEFNNSSSKSKHKKKCGIDESEENEEDNDSKPVNNMISVDANTYQLLLNNYIQTSTSATEKPKQTKKK